MCTGPSLVTVRRTPFVRFTERALRTRGCRVRASPTPASAARRARAVGSELGPGAPRSSCGAGILSDEAFPPLCRSPAAARSHGTEQAKAVALLIAVTTLCGGLWSQPHLTDWSPDVGDAGGLRSRRVSGGAGPGIRAGAPMLAPCCPLVNAAWPESRHSWARRLPSVPGGEELAQQDSSGDSGTRGHVENNETESTETEVTFRAS